MYSNAASNQAGTKAPLWKYGKWGSLAVMACLLIAIFGGGTDTYAHMQGYVPPDNNVFFSPFHAISYAGITLLILMLGIPLLRNTMKGYTFAQSIPIEGGNDILWGVGIAGVGFLFDGFGHNIMGIERESQSRLASFHMVIFAGLFIASSASFRGVMKQRKFGVLRLAPYVSLFASMLLLTMLFHAEHPAELSWQSYEVGIQNLRQGDDKVIALDITTPAQIQRARIIGSQVGLMIYISSGIFVSLMLVYVLSRFHIGTGGVTILFLGYAVPALFTDQAHMLIPTLIIGLITEFVVLRLFPLYNIRVHPQNGILVAGIVSALIPFVYAIWLLAKGVLWWDQYFVFGLPFGCAFTSGLVIAIMLSFMDAPSVEELPT